MPRFQNTITKVLVVVFHNYGKNPMYTGPITIKSFDYFLHSVKKATLAGVGVKISYLRKILFPLFFACSPLIPLLYHILCMQHCVKCNKHS